MTIPLWCLVPALILPYIWGTAATVIRKKQFGTADNKNPRLPTGEIEVHAIELTVFNKADTPPFEIKDESKGIVQHHESKLVRIGGMPHRELRSSPCRSTHARAFPSARACLRAAAPFVRTAGRGFTYRARWLEHNRILYRPRIERSRFGGALDSHLIRYRDSDTRSHREELRLVAYASEARLVRKGEQHIAHPLPRGEQREERRLAHRKEHVDLPASYEAQHILHVLLGTAQRIGHARLRSPVARCTGERAAARRADVHRVTGAPQRAHERERRSLLAVGDQYRTRAHHPSRPLQRSRKPASESPDGMFRRGMA